jgi:NADPH-dependent 2,4-dienoyl-CoA reductase/sulfur reductase-like enzyme/nitrite reductase/ring-hydroxylating ferredoxin subunit
MIHLSFRNCSLLLGISAESTEPLVKAKEKTLSDDFVEESVCDILDVAENEMKEFVIDGDKKILLIKQEGQIHAIGAECAHYGAPLVMGSLGEGRIRCPWHGACFNIETGDIEDFPGLDGIPCFQVTVEERDVRVRARKSQLRSKHKVVKPMAQFDPKSGLIYVLIGGGPSSQTCAETLRQNGFMGRIIMICKEAYLPYDRIKVSKLLESKIEDIQLRPRAFFDDNHIEVMLNIEATDVNASLKEISLSSGNKLKYDKLYAASGSRARVLKAPGSHLNNVFSLRTLNDANRIHAKLDAKSHVVVVGSSFIALEVAAYCVSRVAKVTIVGRSAVPLIDTFGEIIGRRVMEYFQTKQVEFIMETEVRSFLSNNNDLERIELVDGRTIWADVCIVGIGAIPNTEFLANSGIKINYDGSIDTNEFLETNVHDIFVGGDIANSPVFTYYNKRACIQHYSTAQYHGKIAALNMIGTRTELRTVPYFFTLLFDQCFTFTGYGRDVSEIFVDGDLDEFKFAAFYFDEEQNVVGMSSCQPDKGISDFAEKLAQGFCYHRDDIEWAIELEEGEEGMRV